MGKQYTQDEDDKLKALFNTNTDKQLGNMLNRPTKSIKARRHSLGLYKYNPRQHDPHAGEKINSKDDLLIKAVEILEAHPEGLMPRDLISKLIPYEGRYHLPFPAYLGKMLSNVRGTFKKGNKWFYSEDVI